MPTLDFSSSAVMKAFRAELIKATGKKRAEFIEQTVEQFRHELTARLILVDAELVEQMDTHSLAAIHKIVITDRGPQ